MRGAGSKWRSARRFKTVDRWAMFERWVLARMSNEPYAQFLRDCNELKPGLRFVARPALLS